MKILVPFLLILLNFPQNLGANDWDPNAVLGGAPLEGKSANALEACTVVEPATQGAGHSAMPGVCPRFLIERAWHDTKASDLIEGTPRSPNSPIEKCPAHLQGFSDVSELTAYLESRWNRKISASTLQFSDRCISGSQRYGGDLLSDTEYWKLDSEQLLNVQLEYAVDKERLRRGAVSTFEALSALDATLGDPLLKGINCDAVMPGEPQVKAFCSHLKNECETQSKKKGTHKRTPSFMRTLTEIKHALPLIRSKRAEVDRARESLQSEITVNRGGTHFGPGYVAKSENLKKLTDEQEALESNYSWLKSKYLKKFITAPDEVSTGRYLYEEGKQVGKEVVNGATQVATLGYSKGPFGNQNWTDSLEEALEKQLRDTRQELLHKNLVQFCHANDCLESESKKNCDGFEEALALSPPIGDLLPQNSDRQEKLRALSANVSLSHLDCLAAYREWKGLKEDAVIQASLTVVVTAATWGLGSTVLAGRLATAELAAGRVTTEAALAARTAAQGAMKAIVVGDAAFAMKGSVVASKDCAKLLHEFTMRQATVGDTPQCPDDQSYSGALSKSDLGACGLSWMVNVGAGLVPYAAQYVGKLNPKLRAAPVSIVPEEALSWNQKLYWEAIEEARQGKPFGNLQLSKKVADDLKAFVQAAKDAGEDPQRIAEVLHGIAAQRETTPEAFAQLLATSSFFGKTLSESTPRMAIEIVQKLKAIDPGLNTAEVLVAITEAIKKGAEAAGRVGTEALSRQKDIVQGTVMEALGKIAKERPALVAFSEPKEALRVTEEMFGGNWKTKLSPVRAAEVPLAKPLRQVEWVNVEKFFRFYFGVTFNAPTEALNLLLKRFLKREIGLSGFLLALYALDYKAYSPMIQKLKDQGPAYLCKFLRAAFPERDFPNCAVIDDQVTLAKVVSEGAMEVSVEALYQLDGQVTQASASGESLDPRFDANISAAYRALKKEKTRAAALETGTQLQRDYESYLKKRAACGKLNSEPGAKCIEFLLTSSVIHEQIDYALEKVKSSSKKVSSPARDSMAIATDHYLESLHELDIALSKAMNQATPKNGVLDRKKFKFEYPVTSSLFPKEIYGPVFDQVLERYRIDLGMDDFKVRNLFQVALSVGFELQLRTLRGTTSVILRPQPLEVEKLQSVLKEQMAID